MQVAEVELAMLPQVQGGLVVAEMALYIMLAELQQELLIWEAVVAVVKTAQELRQEVQEGLV